MKFDVIVAGAGPSGCAAAIALKQQGFKVCFIDKQKTNSRKVGESIPGASIRLLNRLGINGIEDLLDKSDYKKCHANASAWASEHWDYQSGLKNPEGGGYHVSRTAFDDALQKKAIAIGIVSYDAMIDKVISINDNEFEVQLKYTDLQNINTKWIVDATGRKSAILRQFGLKRNRYDNQMAAVNWIKTSIHDNDTTTRIKSVPEGWWYTSLLPDQSRIIGFQGLSDNVAKMHKDQQLFFEKFNATAILSDAITKENSLENAAFEAGVAKPESATANRIIAVGDAALSFDPLSSQGIFFALYSGIKGAEAIINCLSQNGAVQNSFANYQKLIDNVFDENQKSLRYFYNSEFRFRNEPFWKSRI